MLGRQLDELTAQMIEIRQQSSSTAMNGAVTGLTEALRSTVSKPRPEDMRVGKPEPYALGKDFDDWDFTVNGYAGTLDPAYPALLKTATQSPTVVMATPPHEQLSATLLYLLTMLTQRGARKVVRKAGNNGFETYRQLCLMYGTSDQGRQHGTVRANHDVQVRFQDRRRGRPSERISGTGKTIRFAGKPTTEHSRFEGECRNCGKYGHKAADCWYKQTPKPQGKGKGSAKSKSKVTEISESDRSKQVEETWTPNTSTPQPNLSQVNTIGCADEGLWIFSLEDSKKRRYTVNWGRSVWQQDWAAQVDDRFWMFWEFWTCLPTLVSTAIPNGEFYKR